MSGTTIEVALNNCERERIHQIQLLQPHGFLIAFNIYDGKIFFYSENTEKYFQSSRQEILDSQIYKYINQSEEIARQIFSHVKPEEPKTIEISFKKKIDEISTYEIVAHRQAELIVIEAMPFLGAVSTVDNDLKLEKVLTSLGPLHRHKSLPLFLNACAAQIREISGYQRVLIYRFLPDWSGEVIAEAVGNGESCKYTGLRFPASDIPTQARELYKRNQLRVIGDVNALGIPIVSSSNESLLDQSHSLLRSPSSIHLQYLKNMGVRATMTISMVKDGQLWGMVACHHNEPMTPPASLRRATKLLSALVTESAVIRIDALISQEEQDQSRRFDSSIHSIKEYLSNSVDFQKSIEYALNEFSGIAKYCDWGVVFGRKWIVRPEIPETLELFIENKAKSLEIDDVFFSEKISDFCFLNEDDYSKWSGIALLPLSNDHQSFVFFLRPPLVKQVHWAGMPSKRLVEVDGGIQVLSPRSSFDTWTQTVEGESEHWTDAEKFVFRKIAKTIDEGYLRSRERMHQENLRLLGSCMASLNDMVLVTDTSSVDEPGPRIIYANESLLKKTGFELSELVGQTPRVFQGPKTDRSVLSKIRKALVEWRPITVELINYRKTGEEYWVEIAITPIADSNGWYTHWISVQRDIEERKRTEIDIQKLVYYDVLTGLPNRRLLMDRLKVAIGNAKRYVRSGALMFIDLDHFKNLNDTAGHHVGDELLRQVAIRLVSEVRKQDTVARLGGDEFVVLLEGLSPRPAEAAATAQQIAEKLIKCLDRNFDLPDRAHNCSGSLGISLFGLSDASASEDELIKQADFAMYQAKAAGRNGWRFFDPDTQAALVKRSSLEADLKVAFYEGRLQVHFQPIVQRDKLSIGVEALLRWFDDERGWVSPAEFIPIAEQNGLIVSIGKWVLSKSCELLASWSEVPLKQNWSVSVNVSARQIRQESFVNDVLECIATASCNPKSLKLEITESLLQEDFDATVLKMKILRTYGIQFSVDDFGTGYSSLTYLRKLPISILKIDRSFVNKLADDDSDRAICLAILSLGQTLNLKVVAEGVETNEQFQYLYDANCDYFQGYLFGKAIPDSSL
jgi:diguanylate cyclase (GGDEF)-like protein/PAS domain S-box-containing protein